MMKWKIKAFYHNMEIGTYLRDYYSFSKRLIIDIKFGGGRITVNGQEETVRYRLQLGDVLTIQFPPEQIGENLRVEHLPLDIVYEDNDILIINKPAGIATMPSPQHQTGTIANRILGHYAAYNIPYTIHIVTRLDRDTSGLLLVAKHRYSHSLLAQSQEKGLIKRHYEAVVEGMVENERGVIDAPIGRKSGSIIERKVTENGRPAVTHYQLQAMNKHHSFVTIELETGRTHQIRVHFSHINHPLAGDDLYGGSNELIKRQALHCAYLSFLHPFTKKEVSYHQALPADMRQILPSSRY